MIIELSPPQPQALGATAGELAAPGGNECSCPTWYMRPQAVQGKFVITPAAGFRDRLVAEAERLAFDAIQATAAENSLSFWNNPEEDVYEDL